MKRYKEVNKDLSLIDTPDWGIINSDSERVKEFINYYNNNYLDKSVESEFIYLICSSMNEALIEKKVDDEIHFLFSEYLYNIEETKLNLMILANWVSYESTEVDPFPVADLIRKLFNLKRIKDEKEE